MELVNPFIDDPKTYKREMDILGEYINQTANFLHVHHPEISFEECKKWVINGMKTGGSNEFKNPRVQTIAQRKRGNRSVEILNLSDFLNEIVNDLSLILTPALIAYKQPEELKSLLSEFIFTNVNLRKEYKKLKFKYEQEGNLNLKDYYDILQTAVKELNNSLSGAGISKYNAVYCKTSHLSLTSGCRTATSYANASNEKLIAGNRHYYNPVVVYQDLMNAQNYAPLDEIEEVMEIYNIKYPTTNDVMECIAKSSNKYWRDKVKYDAIREYVDKLDKRVKAAFCYVGDLFHLSKFNEGLVEDILEDFLSINREYVDGEFEELDYLKKLDADKIATISLFKSELMKGKKFEELQSRYPDDYNQINTTAAAFEAKLSQHEKLIKALWKPRYLIPGVAKFKSIIREAVLTSDTDSTIFTTMYWTKKLTGNLDFSKKSYNVGYLVVYLASQVVSNILSLYCANMGVSATNLRMLQMKNEYYFPIYGLTNVSKHYFALRSAQEGVVKPEPELEMKGVQLITSKAPVQFMKQFQDYVETHVLADIVAGNQRDARYYLSVPIEEELTIRENIRAGKVDFYSSEQIKDPESYKNQEDNSTYFQYKLWKDVFAYKYGTVDKPPYFTYKIPVDLDKKAKINRWLDELDKTDPEFANRARKALEDNGKQQLTSILVPQQIVNDTGLPKELLPIIDEARAVRQIMAPYYISLQTLGVYTSNSKNTRLLTDQYMSIDLTN